MKMKCDDVNTSEEEEDEEIRHLKEQLERKRWEKKQGRHIKEQSAFSDETTHSTTSEPSTATTSSSKSFSVHFSYNYLLYKFYTIFYHLSYYN